MLTELIIEPIIIAALSAYFAVGLIDMTSFNSIFGGLKFYFAKYLAQNDERVRMIQIAESDMNAKEQAKSMDELVYWSIARRSKLFYIAMCPYCMGIWVFILVNFGCLNFDYGDIPLDLFTGIATVYFSLNFKK